MIINGARKQALRFMVTATCPADALAMEVKREFGLEDPIWQHNYKGEPMNINLTELNTVLQQAISSDDLQGLLDRLGEGCRVDDGEPVVTLFVKKQASEGLAKASAAAAKKPANGEAVGNVADAMLSALPVTALSI